MPVPLVWAPLDHSIIVARDRQLHTCRINTTMPNLSIITVPASRPAGQLGTAVAHVLS